ncbi:GNAT family N-acetyltransferase [Micrococcaceae bacterium Sec5.7]
MIRLATAADAPALAELAAATLPLVLPPDTADEAAADFIDRHLSESRFVENLADDERVALVDAEGGRLLGYTMLVFGEPYQADTAAAITIRSTVELSGCYVLPNHHGSGTARLLIAASLNEDNAGLGDHRYSRWR